MSSSVNTAEMGYRLWIYHLGTQPVI